MKLFTVSNWMIRGYIAIGAVISLAGLATWHFYFPGRAFNSGVWNDRSLDLSGARSEMADRFLAQGTLIGKSRSDVVEMLGDPITGSGFSVDWDLVHWLGPERGYIGIDSEWLVLRLDEYGRVSKCAIARD